MLRALLLALAVLGALHGQNFDVASVRPHDPGNSGFLVHPPNSGHFTAIGAPGKLLVMIAYGVQESQILGGPSWFASEKWDIEAKCETRGIARTRRPPCCETC